MTLEEIKEELLNDERIQHDLTITATFLALYSQFVKKGIFNKEDIDEINKNTNELVDSMNTKAAKETLAKIKEDSLL